MLCFLYYADLLYHVGDGGRSSVVSASDFKFEDPGFDPQVGQGAGQFLYPSEATLVQTCLYPPPTPFFVVVCTLKIPYPSVVKE